MRIKIDLFQNRRWTIISLMFGLGFGIALYAFLFVVFEAFRQASLIHQLDYWILDSSNSFSRNFVFAAYSMIFGHAVFMQILLSKINRKTINHRYLLRYSLNNQTNLTWYSLFFLFKVAITIGFMYYALGPELINNLGSHTFLIVVLISLVVFLNSWVGINRMLGKKGVRKMLASLVLVGVSSIILSLWSPINTTKMDERIKERAPQLNYDLNYPIAKNYDRVVKRSWTYRIYVQKDELVDTTVISVFNTRISLEEVKSFLKTNSSSHHEYTRQYLTAILAVDKNVLMSEVNKVVEEVLKSEVNKIGFAVNRSDNISKTPSRILRIYYPYYYFDSNLELLPVRKEDERFVRDTLHITNDQLWTLNEQEFSKSELIKYLNQKIDTNQSTLYLNYGDTVSLNAFIQTYDLIFTSLDNARNEYAINKYDLPYSRHDRISERFRNSRKAVTFRVVNLPVKRLNQKWLSAKQKY